MDGTYAPQSPDLSSFLSSPSKNQQPYNPASTSQSTSYAPRSPVIPSFNHASAAAHHNLSSYTHSASPFGVGSSTSDFAEYGTNNYMPPIPALPPTHSFANAPQPPNQNAYFSPQRPSRKVKSETISYSELDADAEDDYPSLHSPTMSGRGPRIKGESSSHSSFPAQQPPVHPNPNPQNIEIKTKFPVARIKRIMQADEEVGKVAQVTPVAVSKALELFMIALVSGAAEKAREKGGKKVTAQHLKMVVEGNPDQFDFLNEIVGRVNEVTEGAGGEGRKRKEKERGGGSSSDEEEKKVKKGRGRRKKGEE
ncbi:histone-fold-containing protein [Hyaloscypha variabilis F]|uniref:NCT transcriptional regulatory complex subunit A n=1 Tax=Hyaloscypha variabilis (strain UAMH 11265 / GT02V1 / F) TaxID=1149755 RepID=A0A2J6RQP7_HYAVF|nr:histone-fold-containing protein [Hyaloscypha variabilis F]